MRRANFNLSHTCLRPKLHLHPDGGLGGMGALNGLNAMVSLDGPPGATGGAAGFGTTPGGGLEMARLKRADGSADGASRTKDAPKRRRESYREVRIQLAML